MLNKQSKELVVRISKYFIKEYMNGGPLLPLTMIIERVAQALNVKPAVIQKINSQYYSAKQKKKCSDTFVAPGTSTCENDQETEKDDGSQMYSYDLRKIIKHINVFYYKNKKATEESVVQSLQDEDLFYGDFSELLNFLKESNYTIKYRQVERKNISVKTYSGPKHSRRNDLSEPDTPDLSIDQYSKVLEPRLLPDENYNSLFLHNIPANNTQQELRSLQTAKNSESECEEPHEKRKSRKKSHTITSDSDAIHERPLDTALKTEFGYQIKVEDDYQDNDNNMMAELNDNIFVNTTQINDIDDIVYAYDWVDADAIKKELNIFDGIFDEDNFS